jgi:SAM-dependent methyltransferase
MSGPTRGHGALESFLARKRAAQANALIPQSARSGRILDIGCGSTPYFLMNTEFAEKTGVDRLHGETGTVDGVQQLCHDVAMAEPLPFNDAHFDVVTMLAVFEHLDRPALARLVAEIYRVLKPGGRYVLTTPAQWTQPILNGLARLGLVSAEEIDEHQPLYGKREIVSILESAGFTSVQFGCFELGLNTWAVAVKNQAHLS